MSKSCFSVFSRCVGSFGVFFVFIFSLTKRINFGRATGDFQGPFSFSSCVFSFLSSLLPALPRTRTSRTNPQTLKMLNEQLC